ncbi:carbohydrate kinase family protein [Methylophaga thiooxydans]|uniref:carbohydrate kinase family protein n=1 Tax=Methylophaga thiooxydans TaxID=392484 RepID=UPI002351FF6C|nr:carbohydrate kinase [Methylophaga thiooxydans]
MNQTTQLTIFGEALFDCFPDGESVLGGAPFNVAWHLQAFGDAPKFISRVGNDTLGDTILAEMKNWGMDTNWVQLDNQHPTGRVNVTIDDNEPSYEIATESAWDFIADSLIDSPPQAGLFYHGSLAARSEISHHTLQKLTESPGLDIFVDVNLRDPWWQKEDICHWLEQARWVKLNQDELGELGFRSADLHQDMTRMHSHYHLDQLIVTCGEKGATVRDQDGEFHLIKPTASNQVIDTVGAGDAFTAMYIHGLLAGWEITHTLAQAQRFASQVVGLRGATSKDANFYNIINN